MTADERIEVQFQGLREFAAELAETWINGNKTDVLETLEAPGNNRAELAILVAENLRIRGVRAAGERLARTLNERKA